jgi:adenylate cyclase class IV
MSWIEVESKVRVRNVKDARRRIKKIAKFVEVENKIDDYYSLSEGVYPKKSIRVRDKGQKREVNFKERMFFKDGIWAKKEVELYRTREGVNIELNFVKKLGWFIEIEVLCKKKDIGKAMRKIGKVRERLGVKRAQIEKSGYTRFLWELRH